MTLTTPSHRHAETWSAVASPDASLRRAPTGGWRRRLITLGAVVAAPAVYAALAGWWTPRGPNGTVQALSAMAIGLGVGWLAGVVLRSGWAIVVSPVVFGWCSNSCGSARPVRPSTASRCRASTASWPLPSGASSTAC